MEFDENIRAIESSIMALVDENRMLREALEDCISGYRYIEHSHGRLYGVGWDRLYNYSALLTARAAIKKATD